MSRILFTGRGLPQCMLGCHPRDQAGTPLGPDRPPRPGRHPQGPDSPNRSMLRDTVNERAVCILLECNLVHFKITETVLDKWQKMKEFGPRHARLLGPNFIFCHCIKLHVWGGRGGMRNNRLARLGAPTWEIPDPPLLWDGYLWCWNVVNDKLCGPQDVFERSLTQCVAH